MTKSTTTEIILPYHMVHMQCQNHIIFIASLFGNQQGEDFAMPKFVSQANTGVLWDGSKSHRRRFVTWWNMHVILRWLEIRTIRFLFNFSSKDRSRVKILRWLKIRREIEFETKMIWILSHLKITCIFHHVTNLLRCFFWAISKYLPYSFHSQLYTIEDDKIAMNGLF